MRFTGPITYGEIVAKLDEKRKQKRFVIKTRYRNDPGEVATSMDWDRYKASGNHKIDVSARR